MKNIAAILFSFAALPILGQAVTTPVARFVPVYPRDGQPVTVRWSQSIAPSAHFGAPRVEVSPQPWGGWTYGGPHIVTIFQTATADAGGAGQSTDDEEVYFGPVEAGTYSVSLELAVTTEAGPIKYVFPLSDFVVTPACSSDASASATYSWEKGGYELHFNDSINGANLNGNAIVSIEGSHVTVRIPLIFGGIPPVRPTCISRTVLLGPIAPGTYRLTWIYEESFAPKTGGSAPTLTRELTFEAPVPRRRTSRR